MQTAARLFSAFCLLALLAAAVFLLPTRPPVPPVPPAGLPALVGPIDLILVEKSARRLTLIRDGRPLRTYAVALGFAPTGDKTRQGDGRTPEGRFAIDRRNDRSAFTLSLGLNYPLPEDIARARAGGYDPGGDIFIHGQPTGMPEDTRLAGDWTAGCIALTNAEMHEIWAVTPIGTPVEIRP
jgi:murein L,D-transpeptidase YafK